MHIILSGRQSLPRPASLGDSAERRLHAQRRGVRRLSPSLVTPSVQAPAWAFGLEGQFTSRKGVF